MGEQTVNFWADEWYEVLESFVLRHSSLGTPELAWGLLAVSQDSHPSELPPAIWHKDLRLRNLVKFFLHLDKESGKNWEVLLTDNIAVAIATLRVEIKIVYLPGSWKHKIIALAFFSNPHYAVHRVWAGWCLRLPVQDHPYWRLQRGQNMRGPELQDRGLCRKTTEHHRSGLHCSDLGHWGKEG